jgi:hypothetical protein
MEAYRAYLELLGQLKSELSALTGLAQEKTRAVAKDDLMGLDKVLRQEQARALSLRSLEKKRQKALEELELTNVPLTKLSEHYPEELRLEAKDAAEGLRTQYRVYQSASTAARNTLECSLHEIEKTLQGWGAENAEGAGYQGADIEPPTKMRTDIRA